MKLEKEENYSTNSGMNEFVDEFSMEYEESISSEEETDSSSNEPLNSNISPTAKYEDEDVEETYNPRNRTVMSTTVSNNDPFEILTVRKDPPSTSIVPKPILKKKNDNNVFNAREIPTFSGLNTKRDRSHSLTDASSPSIPSEKNDQRKLREQSNSPNYVDTIEEHTIEKLPNVNTRRSFSLIPNQATSLKETFRSRKKKNPSSADRKLNESKSVSALANCTSITGTGVIMKENMISNKEIEEEAKVVVDFYGDIVKSFGGKQKPIAEISNYGPKYDTFEEKKICKPDFKEFGQNKTEIKSPITLHEPVPKGNESRLETGISSAVSSYNYERHSDSIYKMNGMANSKGSNIRQVEHEQFEYQRKSVSPSRKRHSPLVDDTSPQRKLFRDTRRTEKSKSRSNSSIAKRSPRSRDASTSPVRFEYWVHDVSSRHSLERDYFRTSSVTSSRSSSLTRQTHSPVRPILRAITTQTSFRVEPQLLLIF
ncbi:hypothetical protein WA026_021464 [Henosepilachna vigintioctopunctata]|uniref:Uncharacterized protein n=1 Tax=Henosepilachna vigintioctopunctata TaxID=420089 RepID=A0AAW1UML3_9CUCU